MKVLLIAPHTDLLYADAEVQRILRSGLTVTPVLGTVNQTTLLDEIGSGTYDVLWLCSHGTKTGIMLSDGLLSGETLSQVVRSSSISLVVLNTCDSIMTAQQLQNETSADVIATIEEVPDREAFQAGALFARALAQTNNVAEAYNIARPGGGNRSYIYLGGAVPNQNERQGRDSQTTVEERLSRLEQINTDTQKTLERIVTLMDGNSSWRIVGLPDQLSAYIKANEDWKKATEQRIGALEEGNPIILHPSTAFVLTVIAILLIVVVYFIVSWLQRGGV